MRRRFLGSMSRDDAEVLQRSTDTIVQQVETMKQMVNAFSDYARTPDMKVSRFSLNELVTEVVDLYRSQDSRVEIRPSSMPASASSRRTAGAFGRSSTICWSMHSRLSSPRSTAE